MSVKGNSQINRDRATSTNAEKDLPGNGGLTFVNTLKSSRAYSLMKSDITQGLSNAYMAVSPDDDAVSDFFSLIAATVFCKTKSACMDCNNCKATLHGNNPDVFRLNSERIKIKVSDMKDLFSTVDVKPLSGTKLYFVERADLMNVDAQNKLLKTLEEPPKGVTVFLGVANESGVLDTIKSRSHAVRLDIFSYDEALSALLSLNIPREAAEIAAAGCEGQLGRARKIALSSEYSDVYKSVTDLLLGLKKSVDIATFDSKPEIIKNTDAFLSVLALILRDVLVAKQDEALVLNRHILTEIKQLTALYSSRALAEIILQTVEVRKKLSLNVNAQAALDSLFFTILEVKYKWQA